jgi:hypothetical protein
MIKESLGSETEIFLNSYHEFSVKAMHKGFSYHKIISHYYYGKCILFGQRTMHSICLSNLKLFRAAYTICSQIRLN